MREAYGSARARESPALKPAGSRAENPMESQGASGRAETRSHGGGMRFGWFGTAFVALLCCARPARAEVTSWIGWGGGPNIPQGDFKQLARNGWHMDGSYTAMLTPVFGLGGDLNYHAWAGVDDLNAQATAYYGPGAGITFNTWQISAHLMTQLPGEGLVHPFLKVGGGPYKYNAKLTTPYGTGNYAKTHFGFNAGGGVNFRVNETLFLGVGAAYHQYDQDPTPAHFVTADAHLLWKMPKFGEVR